MENEVNSFIDFFIFLGFGGVFALNKRKVYGSYFDLFFGNLEVELLRNFFFILF